MARKSAKKAYLVAVERRTLYKVMAADGEDPVDVYLDKGGEEVNQETLDMCVEDDDEDDDEE